MDFLRVAGKASLELHHSLIMGDGVRVATSSFDSCLSSIDCFGRALAIDTAYRHLVSAEQYLMDAQKMQDSAPHTDIIDKALKYIDRAEDFLENYAVSENNVSDRDPPVCVVPETTSKASSLYPSLLIFPSNRVINTLFI